jgi:hypothetical protein
MGKYKCRSNTRLLKIKIMTDKLLYKALKTKYEAQIAEAEATLSIYFNNPVGIGEHPQHLEEMDKFVAQLAEAKDKLETLKYVLDYGTPNSLPF